MAHSCRNLSRFLQHEAARSICSSPGRDASPSQVTSPLFVRFPQQFTGTHLYTWVERSTVRLRCLSKEHNTMSPASARTQTARSTAPPTPYLKFEKHHFLSHKYLSWTVQLFLLAGGFYIALCLTYDLTISTEKIQIYLIGFMKTVSIICAKSLIFHFDFTPPKGSLQAK